MYVYICLCIGLRCKVIDFYSSCFTTDHLSSYVQVTNYIYIYILLLFIYILSVLAFFLVDVYMYVVFTDVRWRRSASSCGVTDHLSSYLQVTKLIYCSNLYICYLYSLSLYCTSICVYVWIDVRWRRSTSSCVVTDHLSSYLHVTSPYRIYIYYLYSLSLSCTSVFVYLLIHVRWRRSTLSCFTTDPPLLLRAGDGCKYTSFSYLYIYTTCTRFLCRGVYVYVVFTDVRWRRSTLSCFTTDHLSSYLQVTTLYIICIYYLYSLSLSCTSVFAYLFIDVRWRWSTSARLPQTTSPPTCRWGLYIYIYIYSSYIYILSVLGFCLLYVYMYVVFTDVRWRRSASSCVVTDHLFSYVQGTTLSLYVCYRVNAIVLFVMLCSADGSTHTESNKLYRKVKHRYRPNLSPRDSPLHTFTRASSTGSTRSTHFTLTQRHRWKETDRKVWYMCVCVYRSGWPVVYGWTLCRSLGPTACTYTYISYRYR